MIDNRTVSARGINWTAREGVDGRMRLEVRHVLAIEDELDVRCSETDLLGYVTVELTLPDDLAKVIRGVA